mgnify:FL=1|tara:strand:+ start:674 stop:925 length:252 start_codon:yes stop_codon:yes gene_type:complete
MINLNKFIQPPKGYVSPEQKEYRRSEKRYYSKLKRLCLKHGVTFSRDGTYWEFSQPIGTIGLNEGVEDYSSVYEYVKEILEEE